MHDSEDMRAFLGAYTQYVAEVIEPTRQELESVLSQWREPIYWGKYPKQMQLPVPSPIHRTRTRTKRPESVVDKIFRKAESYPAGLSGESFRNMKDALGGRVTVYFLSQLPLIDLELRNHELLEISRNDLPVAYLNEDLTRRLALGDLDRRDKESGYASIHYILRLRKSSLPVSERPWFELQVRTLVEDVWAEVEHILGYKPDKKTSFAVRKQFQIISSQLTAIDEHFNFLFEELSRFQEEAGEEVEFKSSDPLNAENLPSVLNLIGVGCAQKQIGGLLKLLASRGLQTVGALQSVGTSKTLEVIRNTYNREEGRLPDDFEIVANLANLFGCENEDEKTDRIKAQLAFGKAWEELKRLRPH